MRVAVKCFGCRLNRAESLEFERAFVAEGVTPVRYGEPAEIVVLHTCAVTQAAEDECVRLLRLLRQEQPHLMLVVAGCAAETVTSACLLAAGADLVAARRDKKVLAQLTVSCYISQHGQVHRSVVAAGRHRMKRAFLKIQDGCDFFCTYCIIPHTRGMPQSRKFAECLTEAQESITAGYEEIVVTGCNIACYADNGRTVVDLLHALSALPGVGRLRISSIEPGTIEHQLLELMARTPQICRFLHLPVQSGDDLVLQAMGRRYSADDVVKVVQHARRLMPEIGLGADFICGFPGEDTTAFERTLQMVRQLAFNNLHVFPYSERPGTPACNYAGSVAMAERRLRAKCLIEAGTAVREEFMNSFVGREVQVLVEHFDPQRRARGWSGEYLPCAVSGVPHDSVGRLCCCHVIAVVDGLLCGDMRESSAC